MKPINVFERNCSNCAWEVRLGADSDCIRCKQDIEGLPKGHVVLNDCHKEVVCTGWNHFDHPFKKTAHHMYVGNGHFETAVDQFWTETVGSNNELHLN